MAKKKSVETVESDWGDDDVFETPSDTLIDDTTASEADDEDSFDSIGFATADELEELPTESDIEETDVEEEIAEAPAAPKLSKSVKVMNGITSTDYNKLKKATKDTPHRFLVKAIAPIVQSRLEAKEIDAPTDEAISSTIAREWDDVTREANFNEFTTMVWYSNISEKAKKRVHNAIRTKAMASTTAS